MTNLRPKDIHRLRSAYGNLALITGATSGIGREMALTLAKAGFDLVITGRQQSVLDQLGAQLSADHHVKVLPIAGDLSTRLDVEALIDSTRHLPIGVAILNAGFGTSGDFVSAEIESEINMLDLNCKAVLMLAHHFAHQMKATPNRGAIVLMSSMVAFQGVPHAAHYAATKAYVQSLGEALAVELTPHGIDVLAAAPGPVESGFSARANMKMGMALRTDQVAVPILQAIGRKSSVLPGFLTKFLVFSLRTAPRWAKVRIMGTIMAGFTKHQLG
ncbi:MAG: SDR family NAD(P)-dependent oxidoreductase [Bacteroidia bacterium]|nr:SDR family NAD(P)-dependent oxidoreductase [Bacteroidia bacterium]